MKSYSTVAAFVIAGRVSGSLFSTIWNNRINLTRPHILRKEKIAHLILFTFQCNVALPYKPSSTCD